MLPVKSNRPPYQYPERGAVIHVVHHHVHHVDLVKGGVRKSQNNWGFLKNPIFWLFVLTTVSMLLGAL